MRIAQRVMHCFLIVSVLLYTKSYAFFRGVLADANQEFEVDWPYYTTAEITTSTASPETKPISINIASSCEEILRNGNKEFCAFETCKQVKPPFVPEKTMHPLLKILISVVALFLILVFLILANWLRKKWLRRKAKREAFLREERRKNEILMAKAEKLAAERQKEHDEDIKSSKFRKRGAIFIPFNAEKALTPKNSPRTSFREIEKVYYDENLNEQFDIGTNVDDIEKAPERADESHPNTGRTRSGE